MMLLIVDDVMMVTLLLLFVTPMVMVVVMLTYRLGRRTDNRIKVCSSSTDDIYRSCVNYDGLSRSEFLRSLRMNEVSTSK